jgi:hypothetical protein
MNDNAELASLMSEDDYKAYLKTLG